MDPSSLTDIQLLISKHGLPGAILMILAIEKVRSWKRSKNGGAYATKSDISELRKEVHGIRTSMDEFKNILIKKFLP